MEYVNLIINVQELPFFITEHVLYNWERTAELKIERGFYIEIYLEIRREKTWVENFPQWDHLTPSLLARCSLGTGELTLVLLVCLPEEGKGVLERSSDGRVGC